MAMYKKHAKAFQCAGGCVFEASHLKIEPEVDPLLKAFPFMHLGCIRQISFYLYVRPDDAVALKLERRAVCAKLENALAGSVELDSDCLMCMMRLGNLVVHQWHQRARLQRLRVHLRVRATNSPANRAHRHRYVRTTQADQAA